jgi:hypothetical protein
MIRNWHGLGRIEMRGFVTVHGQTLDRQTLDRQTLDRQTLDTTNPGHDKPWPRQTLDTIEARL